MFLSKVCSAAAMAHFLRIKTNIARELDAHLFPIIDDLKANGTTLEVARREVFFLKVCAGRRGIRASKRSANIRRKVLGHYDRSMKAAHASGFPGNAEDFEEVVAEFEGRYGTSQQSEGGQAPMEQIGAAFETALCGPSKSKYAAELAGALFKMKQDVIRNYFDSKWVY